MFSWVRNTIYGILVLGIGFGIWRIFGGDLGSFFIFIGNILGTLVTAVANAVVWLWHWAAPLVNTHAHK